MATSSSASPKHSQNDKEVDEEQVINWIVDGEEEDDAKTALAVVAKVWTQRNINSNALIEMMKKIWSPKFGVEANCHGEKDCEESINDLNPKRSFGETIRASPWKVNKGDNGRNDSGRSDVPRRLFITKKYKDLIGKDVGRIDGVTKQLEDVSLSLERGGKDNELMYLGKPNEEDSSIVKDIVQLNATSNILDTSNTGEHLPLTFATAKNSTSHGQKKKVTILKSKSQKNKEKPLSNQESSMCGKRKDMMEIDDAEIAHGREEEHLKARKKRKRRREFKFEKEWLRDNETVEIVEEAWTSANGDNVIGKIRQCSSRLQVWSVARPNDFKKEIKERKEKMEQLMSQDASEEHIKEMKLLDGEIDELERREEEFWAQRSRQVWLKEGDKNTAFFHKKAQQRRYRNTIRGVFDDGGNWREEEEEMEEIFLEFFSNLFKANGSHDAELILNNVVPKWLDKLTCEEIDAIKAIPMGTMEQDDFLAWEYTKIGEFSVKSAYHLEMQSKGSAATTSDHYNARLLWERVWKAQVPPKVKNFAWRAMNNGLPTMVNLVKRNIQVDCICPRCGEEKEDTTHLIVGCMESRFLWKISPLRLDIGTSTSLFEWGKTITTACKADFSWEIALILMWQIWQSHNKWVFNREKVDPSIICGKTMGFLEEFLKVNEREHVRRETQPTAARSWNPPEVGRWKLNTDVAFSKDRTKMGLGMIVRDSVGEVMMCATSPHTPVSNVVQAEGEAMKFGMQYAYEAGLRSLEVESDCSYLISLVKGLSSVRGHTQIIVDEIINKAGLMKYVSFKFAYRSCNKCAHSLAKLALDYDELS
ncbi:hypothetical protein RDABS01_038087 [Bienertia sinuspersici]